MNDIVGQMSPSMRRRLMARRTYSSLTAAKESISAFSWENALTTRMPEKFSCAAVDISENWAWSRSNFWWTRRPMNQKVSETSGMSTTEMSVSFSETPSIEMIVKANVMDVETMFITPGPCIIRVADRSLVIRAMRSPIRWCWKYARCMRWRWANRSLRMSYSMNRDVFIMK